jgi:AraC-like DNA-binding protein
MLLLYTPQSRCPPVRLVAHIRPEIRTFVQIPEGIARADVVRHPVGRRCRRFNGRLVHMSTCWHTGRHLHTSITRDRIARERMVRVPRKTESQSWAYTVVAYLRPSLSDKLQAVIPKSVRVLIATSWADVIALIRQYAVDAVFVDPVVEDVQQYEPLLHLMNEFPSVPLVAYTIMTPATFSAVHILSKHGLHEVVLFGYDDTTERLQALFEDLPQRQLVPLVMRALQSEILRLPNVLRRRVQEVFQSPKRYPSVDALRRGTSYSRSSLYNIFRDAGLGSPGHLLIGARLVHALAYLEDPGHSLRQASMKLGWQDTRILTKYLKRVWGVTHSRPPAGVAPEELVTQLIQWMCGADVAVKTG